MTTKAPLSIDPRPRIAAFHEQGYIILKQFLDQQVQREIHLTVEGLANDVIRTALEEGTIQDDCASDPFETRLLNVFKDCPDDMPSGLRAELHQPGMFGLFFHRQLLDLAEALIGPEIRLYPNYTVRPKAPDSAATEVLWHQDAGYTAYGKHGDDDGAPDATADALRMVNVWTPLVPANVKNGCMQFVPGTHKLGLLKHHWGNEHFLILDQSEIDRHEPNAIAIELDPGDVVLFSNLLLHRGLPNRSSTIRWSCDFRYQDARESTARHDQGHIARSGADPDVAVKSPEHWASLSFQ